MLSQLHAETSYNTILENRQFNLAHKPKSTEIVKMEMKLKNRNKSAAK